MNSNQMLRFLADLSDSNYNQNTTKFEVRDNQRNRATDTSNYIPMNLDKYSASHERRQMAAFLSQPQIFPPWFSPPRKIPRDEKHRFALPRSKITSTKSLALDRNHFNHRSTQTKISSKKPKRVKPIVMKSSKTERMKKTKIPKNKSNQCSKLIKELFGSSPISTMLHNSVDSKPTQIKGNFQEPDTDRPQSPADKIIVNPDMNMAKLICTTNPKSPAVCAVNDNPSQQSQKEAAYSKKIEILNNLLNWPNKLVQQFLKSKFTTPSDFLTDRGIKEPNEMDATESESETEEDDPMPLDVCSVTLDSD